MADNNDNNNGAAGAEKTGFEDKTNDELEALIASEQDIEAQKKINREVFGRAKRAEEKLKGGDGGNAGGSGAGAGQPKPKPENGPKISVMEYAELQAQGLSAQDIVEVAKLAQKYHVTPSEVLADPIMKAGFTATRKKAGVDSRTLPPSRRVSGGGSAPVSQGNDKDTPGIKAGRDAFNRNLSTGDESSE